MNAFFGIYFWNLLAKVVDLAVGWAEKILANGLFLIAEAQGFGFGFHSEEVRIFYMFMRLS